MKVKPLNKMTKKDLLQLICWMQAYIPEDAEFWIDENIEVIFG